LYVWYLLATSANYGREPVRPDNVHHSQSPDGVGHDDAGGDSVVGKPVLGVLESFLNRLAFEDRMAARGDYSSQRKARFLQQRPELRLGAFTPAGQDHYQQIHHRL